MTVDFTHSYRTIDGRDRHFLSVRKLYDDQKRVLKCCFEVDGKETNEVPYEADLKKITVLVEYWDRFIEVPLKLEATAE